MVAIVESLVLQVPPLTVSVSVLVLAGQRVVVPPMVPGEGNGLTVTKAVATDTPHPELMV